jgi:hypothetical protein
MKFNALQFIPATLISVVGVLAVSAPSQAFVINGGFESSLSDWSRAGDVSVTGTFSGFTPPQGSSQALLNTGSEDDTEPNFQIAASAVGVDTLESFLGLAIGDLGADAQSGAGLKTANSFTLSNSGFLTFQYRFLVEPTQADFAVLVLNGTATTLSSSQFTSSTFLSAGTYSLGFGVVNVVDFNGPSQLLVDNVAFTPNNSGAAVPVPPSLLTTLAGAGIAIMKRSANRHVSAKSD